jgi:hypothetical protein
MLNSCCSSYLPTRHTAENFVVGAEEPVPVSQGKKLILTLPLPLFPEVPNPRPGPLSPLAWASLLVVYENVISDSLNCCSGVSSVKDIHDFVGYRLAHGDSDSGSQPFDGVKNVGGGDHHRAECSLSFYRD